MNDDFFISTNIYTPNLKSKYIFSQISISINDLLSVLSDAASRHHLAVREDLDGSHAQDLPSASPRVRLTR